MRSRHPRSLHVWTLAVLTLALLAVPHLALAQVSIDPTATPEKHTGGWIYWMAQASIAMGVAIVVLAGAAYLRFAPRFSRDAREEEAKQTAVPAPPAGSIRIQYEPPPQPATPPAQAATPAPAAAEPQAGVAAAPTQEPAAAAPAQAAPAQQPAAAEAPAAAVAPADAPKPAAPKHEGPVELDQETFDRVLKEQLDKGTDRRVAEGRARSAAVKAAREKAGG